jgi:hypothetical protein
MLENLSVTTKTSHNEHIAKIAALSPVDNFSYFRGVARVDKVLGSSNFGNMPPR